LTFGLFATPASTSAGESKMSKKTRPFRSFLIDQLRDSPSFQMEYLKESLLKNSDEPELIIRALRDIAEARGFESFAEEAGLSRKSLYKILAKEKTSSTRPGTRSDIRFETILKLISALGLRLSVTPKRNAS
jgi:probable addiction module antidote protein